MLDLPDGTVNAWLKRGCVQLLKTDIYDKKNGFLVCNVSNILHFLREDQGNTVVSSHVNSDHVPSFSCLDV